MHVKPPSRRRLEGLLAAIGVQGGLRWRAARRMQLGYGKRVSPEAPV